MLKEQTLILTSKPEEYQKLLTMIKKHFNPYSIFMDQEDFKSAITKSVSQEKEHQLYLLFIEYPFIDDMSKWLNEQAISSPYLIISFSNEKGLNMSAHPYVFELIHTDFTQNDFSFFIHKLNKEIANVNRISLLQFEVKEFYEIGKSLSSEKDTMKLFEMIINSSMKLTSSDAGTIYLVIDKQTGKWSTIKDDSYQDKLLKFVIAKNSSIPIQLETSTTPIMKESIFGHTIITGKSIRIDDAYHIHTKREFMHDKRYDRKAGYKTKSVLSIPMKDHENNVMGVIQLINKKKNRNEKIDYTDPRALNKIIPYDYTDELIMNSLAGQAAVALENNLLYRNMQELLENYKKQNDQLTFLSRKILKAHEEERRRIAREIHDGPAQATANFSLQVEICKKLLQKKDYQQVYQELDNFKKEIQSTVKEIRTIIYDLKPSYLEGGLINALKNRFEIFKEGTGIEITFDYYGDDSAVEYYMASTVFRIVQETLSNVYKHADAQHVKVSFILKENKMQLTIADDGKGFDITKLNQKKSSKLEGGFGIEGIRERVELVKGSISIQSSIGEGTKIDITIPL